MLDEVLLGKTRAAVLREIFLNPDRRMSFNELVRRTRSGDGGLSRELKKLIAAGVVVEEREGNHRFLRAGKHSPLFAELKAFIAKASGAPSLVREALKGLEDRISLALVFGSVAKGAERADSDLDLFVIGTAGYSLVSERMRGIEDRLGRRIQTLYFDANSKIDRASLRKPSTHALLSGPKLFLIGDEERLQQVLIGRRTRRGQEGKPRESHQGAASRPSSGGTPLAHATRARGARGAVSR